VEFPFSSIGQILLEPISSSMGTGKLSITLIKVPTFWMETNSVWNMSGDFTENQQASKVFRHVIEGEYDNLKVEVASIVRSSIDLQQLCRIVSPNDMLYQQQASHFQRRQSCPAGLLFNPNNQIIGNRRLSIPSNTNLLTIPQNVVVQNVPGIVQQPVIDTTQQMLQTATVDPLAKPVTITNSFVAPQPMNQAVVQKMQLSTPSTVTAAATTITANDAATVQLQNAAAAAVNIQKPVSVTGISLSPAQNIKTTIPSQTLPINTIPEEIIQPAAATAIPVPAAATATANTTNVINPLTINSVAATANTNTTDLNNPALAKTNGFLMDNLNIMNGAQLTTPSTDVLNFMNTDSTDSTLVDNSLSTLGNNISLQSTEGTTTFDLGIDDQFLLNLPSLDKNFM